MDIGRRGDNMIVFDDMTRDEVAQKVWFYSTEGFILVWDEVSV